MSVHGPALMEMASHAQSMAAETKPGKMAIAFQAVTLVSVALMGATAAAHLIHELRKSHTPKRGR